MKTFLSLVFFSFLFAGQVYAEKPEWASKGGTPTDAQKEAQKEAMTSRQAGQEYTVAAKQQGAEAQSQVQSQNEEMERKREMESEEDQTKARMEQKEKEMEQEMEKKQEMEKEQTSAEEQKAGTEGEKPKKSWWQFWK